MKQSNNLFEDLTGGTKLLNGKGIFNNPNASTKFIGNDFGLGKEGNLSKSMHSVIIGDDSIDHKYAFDAWTASQLEIVHIRSCSGYPPMVEDPNYLVRHNSDG